MKYGICRLAAIAMRAECSHKSEMVSQLIFGECYEILEESDEWTKIVAINDNYEGWIQKKQIFEISEDDFLKYSSAEKYRVIAPVLYLQNQISHVAGFGSYLTEEQIPENRTSILSENLLKNLPIDEKRAFVEKCALKLKSSPYLWGGRSVFGIDCSGFSQLIYSMIGIQLPRDAFQQVNIGENVDFLGEAKLGDLAFFNNDDGNIVHVGILLDNSQIIHASGRVRIDKIDDFGILNIETKKYSHKLRIIKRIL